MRHTSIAIASRSSAAAAAFPLPWGGNYITFYRGARLITGLDRTM